MTNEEWIKTKNMTDEARLIAEKLQRTHGGPIDWYLDAANAKAKALEEARLDAKLEEAQKTGSQATLEELRQELREALGNAADLSLAIHSRLEELKSGILGQTITHGERFADLENAQDVVERIAAKIGTILDLEIQGDLDAYPFDEMPAWNEAGYLEEGTK